MEQMMLPMLLLLALLGVVLVALVLWLFSRVAKLEAQQENSLTHIEVRGLYNELSELKGQMRTMTDLMHKVQEHLLENER